MKRRIYWSLCIMSILAVILTAALSMWSFYRLLLGQAREDLAQEYDVILKGITESQMEDKDYLQKLDKQFFTTRLTLVSADGTVLYDSGGREETLENHKTRPEIAVALAYGTGEDVRYSNTDRESAFYYARKLPGGNVLRISKPSSIITEAFTGIIPVMAMILFLIIAGGLILAARLARAILRPMESLARDIESAGPPEYDELEPFFRKIKEQNATIRGQMETLREERDTVSAITSNMQEGMILLGTERQILSVNPSALGFLGTPPGNYGGAPVLALSRDLELERCAGTALEGASAQALLGRGGRVLQILANPVRGQGGENCGAIVLLLDVTERQRAEQMRREFSANVSHELKTPLTSISGFAEMLQNGMVEDTGDVRRFASRIYREAQRLITLTDDIIRLSRIEAEGELEKQPVELLGLCSRAADSLEFAAEEKGVTIAAEGAAVTLSANGQMLEELVCNLADNAVKYNRPQGRVTLGVGMEPGLAVLTVTDTGIGIPPEHQERIFERFYRVDKSRSKETGGTGLGLSIVRHIVERHGGTITLWSKPGKGTTVTVRLPL